MKILHQISSANEIIPTQSIINFGNTPSLEKLFTITDSTINTSSVIYGEITGGGDRDIDESEVESFEVKCTPLLGSFNVDVESFDGRVYGQYTLSYIVV